MSIFPIVHVVVVREESRGVQLNYELKEKDKKKIKEIKKHK